MPYIEYIDSVYRKKKSKIIALTKAILQETQMPVKVNRLNSKYFEIKRGLGQDNPLPTKLFNVMLDKIIKDSMLNKVIK